jgi:hypothetical protein
MIAIRAESGSGLCYRVERVEKIAHRARQLVEPSDKHVASPRARNARPNSHQSVLAPLAASRNTKPTPAARSWWLTQIWLKMEKRRA